MLQLTLEAILEEQIEADAKAERSRAASCTALLALLAIALAQPACNDSTVRFEYQLSPPASWLPDSAFPVYPTAAVRDPANLIQLSSTRSAFLSRARFARSFQL